MKRKKNLLRVLKGMGQTAGNWARSLGPALNKAAQTGCAMVARVLRVLPCRTSVRMPLLAM